MDSVCLMDGREPVEDQSIFLQPLDDPIAEAANQDGEALLDQMLPGFSNRHATLAAYLRVNTPEFA